MKTAYNIILISIICFSSCNLLKPAKSSGEPSTNPKPTPAISLAPSQEFKYTSFDSLQHYWDANADATLSQSQNTNIVNDYSPNFYSKLCPCPYDPKKLCPCEPTNIIVDFQQLLITNNNNEIVPGIQYVETEINGNQYIETKFNIQENKSHFRIGPPSNDNIKLFVAKSNDPTRTIEVILSSQTSNGDFRETIPN